MASTATSASPSQAGPGSIPRIRTFQFDGGGIGDLSNAVNLFRGDVNLNQTLVTLPGANQGAGLDIELAIQYQSNVTRQATTWNRDSPTGVVGLGWSLPLTYIAARSGGSPVAATRRYVLYDSGIPNSLTRQPVAPVLFRVSASVKDSLHTGKQVPAEVLTAFHDHGLVLSATAVVEGGGPWTLRDDDLQQLFVLEVSGADLLVRDGGESYQLDHYRFWTITYYPRYERWVVRTEDAIRWSLGGVGPSTEQGYRTAVNNGVGWSVWWTDATGVPAWHGPSTVTDGQVQAASAWYLVGVTDRFGNAVSYRYNGWQRGSDGLIPVVEQQVGTGGKPFTKAVYLTGVTDMFGRRIDLVYGDKKWSDGHPEEAREYADPHRAKPGSEPGPYQDPYETLFLDRLVVRDVSDDDHTALFTITMAYELRNVTANTGNLQGDTDKRFLTGITLLDQDGRAQPGMRLDYHPANGIDGSPGALRTVAYPSGGVVTYAYKRQGLVRCNRSVEVKRPQPVGSPRVYFGPDYAVVCYYDSGGMKLTLQVRTWAGSWLSWQLSADDAVLDTDGLDLKSLDVLADQDFFVVHFARSNEQVCYVFDRDNARPGQWRPARIDGRITAKGTPSIIYPTSGRKVTFTGGATFFVVAQMDDKFGSRNHGYDVVTFRWTTSSWSRDKIENTRYAWIAAGKEYYAVLELVDDKSGSLAIHHLDGTLQWNAAEPAPVDVRSTEAGNVALVPGARMVAIGNLLSENQQQHTFTVSAAAWNAGYAPTVTVLTPGGITDEFGMDSPKTSWVPILVQDTMVAVGGHLWRYNGTAWATPRTDLQLRKPQNREQRFAIGPDYAIRIDCPPTGSGKAEATVLAFDATRRTGWTDPKQTKQALPYHDRPENNWPTAGADDYVVIGPFLYFRGTSCDWVDVIGHDALADLSQLVKDGDKRFNSLSLVDQAPEFLAFGQSGDGGRIRQVAATVLADGRVYHSGAFADQKIAVPGFGGDLAQPGVSPAGPGVFVSYPRAASGFNAADSVFLNHCTDRSVTEPITHYAVSSVTMDNGFREITTTTFVPDPEKAACDASGRVAKYYQTTTYPGSPDPGKPVYGQIVHTYLNGLEDLTGNNCYDMLDGMLWETRTYDKAGTLKESTTSFYQVFQQARLDPQCPASDPVPLRGGWVAVTKQVGFRDGLTSCQEIAYAPKGQDPLSTRPFTTTTHSVGGKGAPETFVRQVILGAEKYDALAAIHALSDIAVETLTYIRGAGTGIPIEVTATTCTGWPARLAKDVRVPAAEATFHLIGSQNPKFPYGTYQAGDRAPAGWQLTSRVTRRTPRGQQRESRDGLDVPSVTLYSTDGEFPVATVSNAAADGMAYLGFQPYEDGTGWTLTGVKYTADDARVGVRAAVLNTGASVRVTVTPPDSTGRYLVGCWYKTPTDFQPTPGSGWTVTVARGGVDETPIFVGFPKTAGVWSYQTIPIDLTGHGRGGGTLTVTLATANASTQAVLVNQLVVMPLVASLIARTFDGRSQLVTSTTDAGGRTSRTCYDRLGQPTVSVGAAGQVRELALRFASRQGSTQDRFEPGSPNAELTLHPAGGGAVETFRDDNAWQNRWDASNLTKNWTVQDGALSHTGAAADTLTWRPPAPSVPYAVYFEVHGATVPDVALAIGDVTIEYRDGRYAARQGTQDWTALAGPPSMAQHWLAVIGAGVVAFFGDGQLLFSRKTKPAGTGIVITAGRAATFRHLTIVQDVRVGICYTDAAGRQRQAHQLHGDDSIVNHIVFDPIGRHVATTRNAPGSLGTAAATLQYSTSFLDVGDFLANLPTTGEMTGDVANYYRGQETPPTRRSHDEGYPYHGSRFEDSPRGVVVETGRPGKRFAIDRRVPAKKRQTLQYHYGATKDYGQATLTSPVRTASIQLTDQLGQLVAAQYNDSCDKLVSSSAANRVYACPSQGPTATLSTELPNFTTDGPQQNKEAYRRISTADSQRQPVSLTDPDRGTTELVHDYAGRLRFVQPALDQDETWFIYYRYDALGRLIEQGTVGQAWDRAALSKQANDPGYPSSGMTVAITTGYDGDGSDPTLIGNKSTTVTHNPAPPDDNDAGAVTVTEAFRYDSSGRMIGVRMGLDGVEPADGTVGYHYNALGEVIQVDLPTGAPIASICYDHDDQGRVVGVGTAPGNADIGSYRYTADGDIDTETLGAGAWTRAISYASPGWPLSMTTCSRDNTNQLGLAYAYEADGAVSTLSADFAFPAVPSWNTRTFRYGYDQQRRLCSAEGQPGLTIGQYDPNGNIWAYDQDTDKVRLSCTAGSDRLDKVTVNEKASVITYNARGQLREGMGRRLTYAPTTALTTSISMDTAAIRLAYGATQQRVLKQQRRGGDNVVYFSGAGQVPVARRRGSRWSVLIQGPAGLLATCAEQGKYVYPLGDLTGSPWALVDADSALACNAYLPFGQRVTNDGAAPIDFAYLYQGQEWDAEIGLYNFRTRMYDPVLSRFLSPDPANQFPSPYVFAGNNPLVVTDPTGEISLWAQIGIGVAMVAIAGAGLALSLATGGASDVAAAGIDAALAGAAEAGEAAAAAGVEAGAAAAEGGAVAAEVTAGASAAGTTAASGWGSTATGIGYNVASSTLISTGISGVQYDIEHGRDFTAKGFFETVGIGAASGAVNGVIGGAGGLLGESLTVGLNGTSGTLASIGAKAMAGAVASAVQGDVTAVLTNVAQHRSWYQGLAAAALQGAVQGAIIDAGTGSLGQRANIANGLVAKGVVSDQTVQTVSTVVDRVKQSATSSTAYASYVSAAFFLTAGYVVWGVAES
ncbi:MAG: RHS repeat-associated core domain-containing protein [Pseudonocardiaceae bacterium]